MSNTLTVKILAIILFIFSHFFIIEAFSIVYTNWSDALNTTLFCNSLGDLGGLPQPSGGTTCEISPMVKKEQVDDYSNMNGCRTQGTLLRNFIFTDECGDTTICTQRITIFQSSIIEGCTEIR